MSRRIPHCPDCPEAHRGVPLVYGLPSPELFEAAERGEAVLGGCVVEPGPVARWACPACGHGLSATAPSR